MRPSWASSLPREALRQDADHLAAPGQDGVRDGPHQPDGPAAVDEAEPPVEERPGQRARRVGVRGPPAERRPAEDAEALHSRRPSASSAKRRHSPGTPLRGWSPRSWKRRPEPATRSLTVLDTRTSPGPAAAATRAPMWTASPETLSSRSSTSPVCRPARTSSPSAGTLLAIARAQRTAAGGAVEGGEEPVARGVDLAAPEAAELAADEVVVSLEEVAPAAIPEGGGLLRGADDVGEEDGGEHPVGLGAVPDAGQELLDLVEDRVRVVRPGQVIDAGQLDEPGSRDLLGHVAAAADRERPIAGAVEDERRHADRWQHVADVDLGVHLEQRQRRRLGSRPSAGAAPTTGGRARPGRRSGQRSSSPTGPPHSRSALLDELPVLLGRDGPGIVGRPVRRA